MLRGLKDAMEDLAGRAGTGARSAASAVSDAVGGAVAFVSESRPVAAVSDGVSGAVGAVSDAVSSAASTVSDAAVGAARSARDLAVGAATGTVDAVSSTVQGGGRAIGEAVDDLREPVGDGIWAVERPLRKTGAVTAGMASHLAPVLLEKAVSRLMPSVFLGPLAPIGKVIAVIELVGDARRAAARLGELLADADRDLDAATRRRLEERRFRAEERLAELLADPVPGGNGEIPVVAFSGTAPGEMAVADVSMDARLLSGPFADRLLVGMTPDEIRRAAETAELPDTRRILAAWLRARGNAPDQAAPVAST